MALHGSSSSGGSSAEGVTLAAGTVAANTGSVTENTLVTVTIPAGYLGANGRLEIETLWTVTNNANAKTMRVKLNGTAVQQIAMTSVATAQYRKRIQNKNAQNSQVTTAIATVTEWATGVGAAVATYAIDTSAAVTLTITVQLAVGTDSATLDSYCVTAYPKA